MSAPTGKYVKRWRERWNNYTNLPNEIAKVLKGDKLVDSSEEARGRKRKVRELLRKYDEFEDYNEDTSLSIDLRGIPWSNEDLKGIWLHNVHLEGADLSEADLERVRLWRAHLEEAELNKANLENAYFYESHIEGAYFYEAGVVVTDFSKAHFLPRYRDLIRRGEWKNVWKLFINRWFYTNFRGVRIEEADTILASDLRRYVEDQRFVDRIRGKSKWLYHIWNLTTACGWSSIRVLFMGLLLILFFGCLYANAPFTTPNWIVNILDNPITSWLIVEPGGSLIANPESYDNIPRFWYWNYVSFDIFTNLGIRVTTKPVSVAGIIFMFLETVMGWVTLGLMLSVFANKYARRS